MLLRQFVLTLEVDLVIEPLNLMRLHNYHQHSHLDQLDQLEEIVLDGSRIPFSGNRLVNEQDAIELLDEIRESMPKSIVQATKLLKQGDQYISKSKSLAEDVAGML